MKLLLLISITLFINGCSQKIPDCTPVACEMIFPALPTYKTPPQKTFTKPILLANGLYAVNGDELRDVFKTNAKFRRICSNYATINIRVNKTYQKDRK